MAIFSPTLLTVEIADAEQRLSPLANDVARKAIRVIVEESRAPIAALVSLDDLYQLEDIRREREEAFAVVDRMRAAFADVSPEEIEREVSRAVSEVRAEMEAERSETIAPG